MLTDYAALGAGGELWNTARLAAYLANVGSPFHSGASVCGCETLTPVVLGETDGVYDTPATDPAPWYDPDHPVTGEFLGFMPLALSGLDDNPRARTVTGAVGGGGVFGPVRELPRTVTVTGLLIGATCCGSEFGLTYLAEALAGCTGDACDGDCLTMYDCCPEAGLTPAQFNAQHRRTYRRAALVSGPTVTGRVGSGTCTRGTCGAVGDIIEVEFVIVIAAPWPWTDTTELLDVTLPATGTGDCIDWCLTSGGAGTDATGGAPCAAGECTHASCTSATDPCADPRNSVTAPPQPTVPTASFCVPIANDRAVYTLDLSTRPTWGDDAPMVTLTAGSADLRNVIISLYERPTGTTQTCEEIADANRCAPVNRWVITYVQAGGSVTIDGQIGMATIECEGSCQTASTVFGDLDGGPVKVNRLTCAQYCLVIEVDPTNPPAPDAGLTFSVSGRVH